MGHEAPISDEEGVPLLLRRPIRLRRCRRPANTHVLSHDVLCFKRVRGERPALVVVIIDPMLAQATIPIPLVLAHLAVRMLAIIDLHAEHIGLDQARRLPSQGVSLSSGWWLQHSS